MPFNPIEQIRSYTRKHEPEDLRTRFNTINIDTELTGTSTKNNIMSPVEEAHQYYQPIRPIMTSNKTISKKTPAIYRAKQSNIRSKRVIFNPSTISLVLMCHLISNQLFTQTILTTSRKMTIMNSSTIKQQSNSYDYDSSLNNNYNSINQSGSLFQMVLANPAPAPSPASARSATSVSHRVPPINGSMFGKRSLDNLGKSMAPSKRTPSKQSTTLTMSTAEPIKSPSENYNDVITELIETFLAKNNADTPDEASVAFCRMIVYECNQLLKVRDNHRLGQRARR